MAITVKTTSYDGIRTQIRANLKLCGIPNLSRLEIITSKLNGPIIIAWVIDMLEKDSHKAIIKGPPCETCDEALQGLLDATSEMVSKKLEGVFVEFGQQLSEPIGDAFVLEDLFEGRVTT